MHPNPALDPKTSSAALSRAVEPTQTSPPEQPHCYSLLAAFSRSLAITGYRLIHRRHGRRIRSGEAKENATNDKPQYRKSIYRVAKNAQVKWSWRQLTTATGRQDALRHSIRQVQHDDGRVDNGVKGTCAGDI